MTDKRAVSELLRGLRLYESNATLCRRFEELMKEWSRAYPDVDIAQQIVRSHAWQFSNPSRRKKDQVRYLNNWLKREQQDVDNARAETHRPGGRRFASAGQQRGKFDGLARSVGNE